MATSQARILLTGVSGQVGGELRPLLQQFASVIAPTREELDLCNAGQIRRLIHEINPQWIVNAAAYTAVDKAESDRRAAYSINAEAPGAIGEAAAELGLPVIHFSTDYVYDGTGTRPWVESDATVPLGVYGASKLAGEKALAASGAAHLIFRTSWVYGSRGKNFLLTIVRRARQQEELRIVDDQHGAPTSSRDLARMVVHVMRWLLERSAANASSIQETVRAVQGEYHAANSGETTWFGFAQEFLRIFAAARPELKLARLVPIQSSEHATPARRPSNSRLDCSRLNEVFGFTMPAWQDAVAAVMDEVLRSGAA